MRTNFSHRDHRGRATNRTPRFHIAPGSPGVTTRQQRDNLTQSHRATEILFTAREDVFTTKAQRHEKEPRFQDSQSITTSVSLRALCGEKSLIERRELTTEDSEAHRGGGVRMANDGFTTKARRHEEEPMFQDNQSITTSVYLRALCGEKSFIERRKLTTEDSEVHRGRGEVQYEE